MKFEEKVNGAYEVLKNGARAIGKTILKHPVETAMVAGAVIVPNAMNASAEQLPTRAGADWTIATTMSKESATEVSFEGGNIVFQHGDKPGFNVNFRTGVRMGYGLEQPDTLEIVEPESITLVEVQNGDPRLQGRYRVLGADGKPGVQFNLDDNVSKYVARKKAHEAKTADIAVNVDSLVTAYHAEIKEKFANQKAAVDEAFEPFKAKRDSLDNVIEGLNGLKAELATKENYSTFRYGPKDRKTGKRTAGEEQKENIRALNTALAELGCDVDAGSDVYSERTKAAVNIMQNLAPKYGLKLADVGSVNRKTGVAYADGSAGEKTRNLLAMILEEKIAGINSAYDAETAEPRQKKVDYENDMAEDYVRAAKFEKSQEARHQLLLAADKLTHKQELKDAIAKYKVDPNALDNDSSIGEYKPTTATVEADPTEGLMEFVDEHTTDSSEVSRAGEHPGDGLSRRGDLNNPVDHATGGVFIGDQNERVNPRTINKTGKADYDMFGAEAEVQKGPVSGSMTIVSNNGTFDVNGNEIEDINQRTIEANVGYQASTNIGENGSLAGKVTGRYQGNARKVEFANNPNVPIDDSNNKLGFNIAGEFMYKNGLKIGFELDRLSDLDNKDASTVYMGNVEGRFGGARLKLKIGGEDVNNQTRWNQDFSKFLLGGGIQYTFETDKMKGLLKDLEIGLEGVAGLTGDRITTGLTDNYQYVAHILKKITDNVAVEASLHGYGKALDDGRRDRRQDDAKVAHLKVHYFMK